MFSFFLRLFATMWQEEAKGQIRNRPEQQDRHATKQGHRDGGLSPRIVQTTR